MKSKFILSNFLLILNYYCSCLEPPFYTAAVVEAPVNGYDLPRLISLTKEMVDVINSPEVKSADIIVLPEALFNWEFTPIDLPKSTVYCDDSHAHFLLRNISCAARNTKKYIVIDVYTKIKCSDDDQPFCANQTDHSNVYNMQLAFDRQGATIAKYRKFHLYDEKAQRTIKPELVTFRTDFNVTFGLSVCFDLYFDSPSVALVKRGVRNFAFSTMWYSGLPYGAAVQFQQSWAYANNVNLLAANSNSQQYNASGSGIYAGRLGALNMFVSPEKPVTKVLVAKVPTQLPPDDYVPQRHTRGLDADPQQQDREDLNEDEGVEPLYDKTISQEDMRSYEVEFLDFTERLRHNGTVCKGKICCHYDIDISDNGVQNEEQPQYYYAISVIDGHRNFSGAQEVKPYRQICSVIACVEMNEKNSCGKRFATGIQQRYTLKRLNLKATLSASNDIGILPSTIANDLYPLDTRDFDFQISKSKDERNYAITMNLNTPKSDLLTFGIIARNFKKDIYRNVTAIH